MHVPFCARRCTYCDFAIAVRREVPVAEYADGLRRELEARSLGGQTLETLYLGGGTPSKLGGTGVAHVIDAVRERFTIADGAEVTIEANPEDVTADAARAWRASGVNRLSLGAQSFAPNVLEWMHRTHTADDIARAVHTARDEGIGDLSLDLIFALPDALERDWQRDVDAAIALEPNHLSVYGLTVEPHAALGHRAARGETADAPEERWAAEFVAANAALTSAGYSHYEVSNYAREGHRARHNEAYWLGNAYLGVGPSAHGYDLDSRRWNEAAYAHWVSRVAKGEDPVAGSERLTAEQRMAEAVYLGLRTDRGLALEPRDTSVVQSWVGAGWAAVLERHGSRTLQLTPAGWMRLDSLAASLTAFRSRY